MSQNQPLETLQDIKRIMERSSRFISLSGLSGVSAGVFALIGTFVAGERIREYYDHIQENRNSLTGNFNELKLNLFVTAMAVMLAALVSAIYFTWRKARHDKLPVWDPSSRRMLINLFIPIVAGGLFIVGMLYHNEWHFVAPACLVFYGLGLVNASKYTYTDIRYVGLLEIMLGIISLFFPSYGLYFWAAGFGILHIVYGVIMWWKYERTTVAINS